MGGVGPLRPTGFDEAARFAGRQECIQEALRSIVVYQPLTKIMQQGDIEARIGQFEAKGMSGSQGTLLLPSPLRTGRAPLNASGSSKPFEVALSQGADMPVHGTPVAGVPVG